MTEFLSVVFEKFRWADNSVRTEIRIWIETNQTKMFRKEEKASARTYANVNMGYECDMFVTFTEASALMREQIEQSLEFLYNICFLLSVCSMLLLLLYSGLPFCARTFLLTQAYFLLFSLFHSSLLISHLLLDIRKSEYWQLKPRRPYMRYKCVMRLSNWSSNILW